ncbi:hypothetical protein SDC9_81737 [bioreactor metagenome]|uniref:Uncharacterized protein n=1 Tax=bioreactor metagenome TaxID=1076179 RepID=A0A644Z3G6_9ZZZZ|nr:hypothetical protein [Oscillospiraceae bacterium]
MDKPLISIILGDDGKYRWVYDLNLYKTPIILFMLWKIIGLILSGIWLFIVLISSGDFGFWPDGFLSQFRFFIIFIPGFLVFTTVCYYIYVLFIGGKYCVMFEMNEKGIRHTQAPQQFKKAQALAAITAITGIAKKAPGITGAGILAGTKQSIYSDFKSIKTIQVYKRQGIIKLNSPFCKNQIYVVKEDFNFVLEYIITHTKATAITIKN